MKSFFGYLKYISWRLIARTLAMGLLEQGDQLIPVEIKAGQTITTDYFSGLQYWQTLSKQTHPAWLVYAGKQRQQRQQRHSIDVIGWQEIGCID